MFVYVSACVLWLCTGLCMWVYFCSFVKEWDRVYVSVYICVRPCLCVHVLGWMYASVCVYAGLSSTSNHKFISSPGSPVLKSEASYHPSVSREGSSRAGLRRCLLDTVLSICLDIIIETVNILLFVSFWVLCSIYNICIYVQYMHEKDHACLLFWMDYSLWYLEFY